MNKILHYISIFLFSSCLFFNTKIHAQNPDRSGLRISLFTCTPGEELYSIFGHSAIRVVDSITNTDIVFNYGTFDFSDDGFYIKFARGKLNYFISAERTVDFVDMYKYENRGIFEQLLNLNENEKIALKSALIENCKETNKYYKYDFFLDNCTTRLRDLISKFSNTPPTTPFVMPEKTRFREAIHQYLEAGGQYWSELGIDILLGLPTDKIMTASEQQFLPDNLKAAIDNSSNIKMVSETHTILQSNPALKSKPSFLTPKIFFWSLFVFFFMLGYFKNRFAEVSLKIFDRILFFTTGAMGILLILMWTATDHSMTKNNLNLIWALPTNLVAVFFISSSFRWAYYYFKATSLLMLALLFSWSFLPQQLNTALIPLVLLLMTRAYKIASNKNA
jgi:hypothetical protein